MIRSAGIILFRIVDSETQVLLVHPGGPLWEGLDLGAWSIPKGEYEPGEDPTVAAKREFNEETGLTVDSICWALGSVRLPHKIITIWAAEQNADTSLFKSNLFSMEWPPRSGKVQQFPETDQAKWFTMDEASQKIHSNQRKFLVRLVLLIRQMREVSSC